MARALLVPVLAWLLVVASLEAEATTAAIGWVTGLEGKVHLARASLDRPLTVDGYTEVASRDILQTQPASRAKVLFLDDTLLVIGEDTRIRIEQRSPSVGRGRLVFTLEQGRVRILIGRAAPEARVEVNAGTATVTASEGAFAVWLEPERPGAEPSLSTSVMNIGGTGLTFTSAGQSAVLAPGQSSRALAGRSPMLPELVKTARTGASRAVQDTQVRDTPVTESPRQVLQASGGVLRDQLAPGGTRTGLHQAALEVPGTTPPMIPLTPPAVISGAARLDAASGASTTGSPSAPSAPVTRAPVTPPATPPVQPVPSPAPSAAIPPPVASPAPSPATPAISPAPATPPAVPPRSPSTDLRDAVPSVSAPAISLKSNSGKGGGRKGGKGKDD